MSSLLVFPMFVMVLLTGSVMIITFRRRVRAVREGVVPVGFYKTYQGAVEPDDAARASRHFVNLFEAPTLFYVACLAAMVTDHGGVGMQVLAWAYVAARMAHAVVHIGQNKLRKRMISYFTSWVILLALWVSLAVAVTVDH